MPILKMRWLFNPYVAWTLLCFLGLALVAFVVNIAGIRIAGGVQEWMMWLKDHALIFLIWRMVLYTGVVLGWRWMRKRVLEREEREKQGELQQGQELQEARQRARQRLTRIEVAAVALLLILEISTMLA